jgi:hypothetical protein
MYSPIFCVCMFSCISYLYVVPKPFEFIDILLFGQDHCKWGTFDQIMMVVGII